MKREWDKRGVERDMLAWIIIAVVVLGIFLGFMFYLKGTGMGAIDTIKNILRFGK